MGMMRNFQVLEPSCPSDLTHDGQVNVSDLLAIIGDWGTPFGDVSGDDKTDVNDVLVVIDGWGICDEGYRDLPRVPIPYRPNPSK